MVNTPALLPDMDSGWIWRPRPSNSLSDPDELADWEKEGKKCTPHLKTGPRAFNSSSKGDRVQWFRAEAEMMRWLEELELKHFELLRTIKSFDYCATMWRDVGEANLNSGRRAYARRQASIYQLLSRNAVEYFGRVAEPIIVGQAVDVSKLKYGILVDLILKNRMEVVSPITQNVAQF